jgi:parallel beta-helix repeat protein
MILVSFSLVVSIFASVGTIGDVQASGPTYTPHSLIRIDKNSDFETQRSSGGWTGSGTVNDPYIINGYNITGGGTSGSSCIYIGNSTAHVIISDCKFQGASYGIQLRLSSNVVMTNNNCTDIGASYGIYYNESNNNTASNNVLVNRAHAIFMLESDDNTLLNNTCRATAACAIMLKSSSNRNIISNNLCYSSGDNGIYVLASDYNTISNNTLKNNRGHGIHLADSDFNDVYYNEMIGNNGSSSIYNALHPQCADTGVGNHWSTESYGNYWSDWTTPDANGDGIVDNPYSIAEGSGMDNYPLVNISIPATTVPGVPTGVTATAGNGQVNLTWIAPNSTDGAAIDHYIVYQDNADAAHVTSTSTTISGLTNGQLYSFTVAAHNIVGTGSNSTEVQAMPYNVPDAPTGYTANPGNGQVTLNWTPPAFDGGAAIDYYIVYQDGIDVAHPAINPKTITGLTNGQSYAFTVAAHNSVGTGPQCNTVPTTPLTIPGTPNGLFASSGNGQVSLSWSPPSSNGGATIDYYIVFQNGIDIFHSTAVSTNVTGLTNWQSYNFTVAANNSVGTGNQTSAVTATPNTSAAAPGIPTDLISTAGIGTVTLSWAAPSGSSTIDYFIVYQNGVDVSHTNGTSATINGLTSGENYSFTVAAHNSGGVGAQSSAQTVSPSATSSNNGATVSSGNDNLANISVVLVLLVAIIITVYLFSRRSRKKSN